MLPAKTSALLLTWVGCHLVGSVYSEPKVSSSSVRFETSSFPPMQNPGGPTQIYRFTTAEEGAAKIEIPHTGANPTFKLTIQVIAP
jgi:hypothetical protein